MAEVIFDNYDEDDDWDVLDMELECLFNNHGDNGFIITGSIGRWDGTYDGGKIFDGLNGFYKTGALEDLAYVRVEFDDDGNLLISGSHHDGNNSFIVRQLTEKGRELIEEWSYDYDDTRSEREIHKLIMENEEYSIPIERG